MNERIGLAVIALDEAEALHGVEELDRAAGLFAGQLALRPAPPAGRTLDRHRLAFDAEVGRRNAAAAIDQREFERLAVGEVGQTRLLDRGNVHEHILAAIIANDEAETLLRIEEFDDAFAFADDLGGIPPPPPPHAAAAETAAATAAAAAAAITAATAAADAAATAAVPPPPHAAEAAASPNPPPPPPPKPPRSWKPTFDSLNFSSPPKLSRLSRPRPPRSPLRPLSKPMNRPNFFLPDIPKTNALGPTGATGRGAKPLTHRSRPYKKNSPL